MAVTYTTNWAGDVVDNIYKVLGVGNQVVSKGAAYLETGVRDKRALPYMTLGASPVGAYEATPTSETADTDYAERQLDMVKGMLYEVMNPVTWHDIWAPFASQGMTVTNLQMNPVVMDAVMSLYADKVGSQFSSLFWNGDISGSGDLINGIITKAAADSNVVDVTNIGEITETNVFDVLQDVWDSVPDQFIDDPDYKIFMSTTDWRKAQSKNRSLKEDYAGSLDSSVRNLFLDKRIEHFSGIPENTIVAAKGTNGEDSNLIFGFYATPDAELGAPRLDYVSNNSDNMFVRVNFKLDAQYRYGGEIVLYQGS